MVPDKDKEILRILASRVREISELPQMKEKKKRWYDHNTLKPGCPMVFCYPEGAWTELLPEKVLECENEKSRAWELDLRRRIYWWENIHDDYVIEPWFNIKWKTDISDYGMKIKNIYSENRGSYTWEAPIKDIEKDMEKLHFRKISIDRENTLKDMDIAREIFKDILPVRIRGRFWWTVGITIVAVRLLGLENLMLYMYDEPESVHKLMAWLRDEHLNFIQWFEREGFLTLNNENDYIGSGGLGYTKELPENVLKKTQACRLKDIWGFAESQETVGISPEMFAEFILPYQMPLLEKFGMNCYGCCEPVHERWKYIKDIPNLRRISISPWCNQEIMAANLGKDYIFSRKANPTTVCVNFNEKEIRKEIRHTLDTAKDNILEIILKDTHTVQNDPARFAKWVKIVREEIG